MKFDANEVRFLKVPNLRLEVFFFVREILPL